MKTSQITCNEAIYRKLHVNHVMTQKAITGDAIRTDNSHVIIEGTVRANYVKKDNFSILPRKNTMLKVVLQKK